MTEETSDDTCITRSVHCRDADVAVWQASAPLFGQDCNSNGIEDAEEIGPLDGYFLAFDEERWVEMADFGAAAPTTKITIEFWQRTEAAAEQFTFGLSPDISTNRISAHAPWSDGNVYWDFGNIDATVGVVQRLGASPSVP